MPTRPVTNAANRSSWSGRSRPRMANRYNGGPQPSAANTSREHQLSGPISTPKTESATSLIRRPPEAARRTSLVGHLVEVGRTTAPPPRNREASSPPRSHRTSSAARPWRASRGADRGREDDAAGAGRRSPTRSPRRAVPPSRRRRRRRRRPPTAAPAAAARRRPPAGRSPLRPAPTSRSSRRSADPEAGDHVGFEHTDPRRHRADPELRVAGRAELLRHDHAERQPERATRRARRRRRRRAGSPTRRPGPRGCHGSARRADRPRRRDRGTAGSPSPSSGVAPFPPGP